MFSGSFWRLSKEKNRALIRGLYMVYGFKHGNTPGFIPLVYIPYTFSKKGKCLHNRFAMLARAQTKLNPRPIEAGIQATPMARRFGLWLNQIAAALSTRRRRMKASSRERGADSFSREDAWCDVASHLRRSGVRFTAGSVDLPPMPLCFDRAQPKTLPSPPCVAGSIYMRIEAVSVVLTASIRLCG